MKIKYIGERRCTLTPGNIYTVDTVSYIDGKPAGYICYCDLPGLAFIAAKDAVVVKEEELNYGTEKHD